MPAKSPRDDFLIYPHSTALNPFRFSKCLLYWDYIKASRGEDTAEVMTKLITGEIRPTAAEHYRQAHTSEAEILSNVFKAGHLSYTFILITCIMYLRLPPINMITKNLQILSLRGTYRAAFSVFLR